MTISFNQVPTNSRIPAVYTEYDNSSAIQNLTDQPYKCLVMGQKTSAGTQAALTPIAVSSEKQASDLFGPGSMLHEMAKAFFARSATVNVDFVAFVDPTGVLATGSINFAGTATAAGTLNLYIGGKKVAVAVAVDDTDSDLADAFVSAINGDTSLVVTAALRSGDDTIVDISAKNKGPLGNEIDIRFNYNAGDATPAGITHPITAMSSGSGLPDLTTLWSVIGDTHYNVMAVPYNDSASLNALEAHLSDVAGPERQIEAVAFSCKRGSVGTVQTLGNSRNSEFVVMLDGATCPNPGFGICAEVAKEVTLSAANDPARPIQNKQLTYTLAPALSARRTSSERNTLLFDGVATLKVGAGDKVYIERLVTTYQENSQGADDISYLDAETLFTLSYLRYDIRTYFAVKYPDYKVANDGTRFGAGQPVLTPKVAKAECLARFAKWEEKGLVENISQFKEDLIVERDPENTGRLNILLPTDLVNQLRQVAIQIGYRL